MEQWLRGLAGLPADPGLIHSTHWEAYNYLNTSFRGSHALFQPLLPPVIHVVNRHTYKQNTHTHKKYNKEKSRDVAQWHAYLAWVRMTQIQLSVLDVGRAWLCWPHPPLVAGLSPLPSEDVSRELPSLVTNLCLQHPPLHSKQPCYRSHHWLLFSWIEWKVFSSHPLRPITRVWHSLSLSSPWNTVVLTSYQYTYFPDFVSLSQLFCLVV